MNGDPHCSVSGRAEPPDFLQMWCWARRGQVCGVWAGAADTRLGQKSPDSPGLLPGMGSLWGLPARLALTHSLPGDGGLRGSPFGRLLGQRPLQVPAGLRKGRRSVGS